MLSKTLVSVLKAAWWHQQATTLAHWHWGEGQVSLCSWCPLRSLGEDEAFFGPFVQSSQGVTKVQWNLPSTGDPTAQKEDFPCGCNSSCQDRWPAPKLQCAWLLGEKKPTKYPTAVPQTKVSPLAAPLHEVDNENGAGGPHSQPQHEVKTSSTPPQPSASSFGTILGP